MRLILLTIAALSGTPALAERVLTADEFARMVTGKTLHFDRFGAPFGSEQYFGDKRVIWAFEGGDCQRGIWYDNAAGEICFVYDTDPASQCWDFLETDDGEFHARLSGSESSADLITSDVSTADLDCPLPDLGV